MNSLIKTFVISVLFSVAVAFLSYLIIFFYESYISYGSIRIVNLSNVIYFVVQSSLLVIFQLILINFLIGILLEKYKVKTIKQSMIYGLLTFVYFSTIFYLTDFRLIVINPT